MGVPQFFHWLVTHYEKHLLREDYGDVPPDYLYLDFNCGIHPAAKQEGIETLDQMYDAVCNYLMKVVKESTPLKMLYIAIDGVAPLAKMKQQRIRRFKVVQDKKELARINARHKKTVDDRFDFNMISPGTEFMEKLSMRLKIFIKGEMKRKFPKLKVMLSDASEPGEGEHKIMAHIRDFTQENDRIVVYGLDSDLIFLSLLHYRPNFCLLREKIFFGKSKSSGNKGEEKNGGGEEKGGDGEEKKFTFFDIGKFREILLAILTPELSRHELMATGLLLASNERSSEIPVINIQFFDDVDHEDTLIESDDDGSSNGSGVDGKSSQKNSSSNDPNRNLGFNGLLTSWNGGSSNSSLFKSRDSLLNSNGGRSGSGGRPQLLQSAELRRGRMESSEAVRLILDYVAVCFVLGNDFLPYLPSLKIKEGGLNRVLECYKMVQEELVGLYLVQGFKLNREFLMKWLEYIVCYEETDLKQHTENREVRVSKFQKSYRYRTAEEYERDLMEFEYIEDKCKDTLRMGFPYWQDKYYRYYVGTSSDNEILDRWVRNYLEGVLWTLRYYQGNAAGFNTLGRMSDECCPDWGWQYHFRAGPPASLILSYLQNHPEFELDYTKISDHAPLKQVDGEATFRERNRPVEPYEQLMMILPPQSGALIHPKLLKLMTQVDSPLVYLYPTNFQIDMMRHRYRWECYPILPDLDMELTRRVVGLVMSVERMPKIVYIQSANEQEKKKSAEKKISKKESALNFKKMIAT